MLTWDLNYIITIGDTNVMGNVYFANYFKLQGLARELWLKDCVTNYDTHLKSLFLSTAAAHCNYKIPFFLYDEIIIKLYFSCLKNVSVKFNFDFYKKGNDAIHASGWQTIVFQNHNKKPCRMPSDFTTAFKNHLCQEPLVAMSRE